MDFPFFEGVFVGGYLHSSEGDVFKLNFAHFGI